MSAPESRHGVGETVVTELWKEAAGFFSGGDALDAEGEGGGAHRDFFFAAQGQSLGEGAFEDAEEFVHDLGFGPEKALEVLDPFELGNDDAAGVTEDVGNDENFGALIEDDVSLGCRGAIGAFGEDPALDAGGIFGGDLTFEGGGDEDVTGCEEELVVGDGLGFGETGDGFGFGDVFIEGDEVEAFWIENAAVGVANGDNFDTVFGKGMGGDGTDIAVALDDGGGAGRIKADGIGGAIDEVGDAAAGGFAAAK